MQNPIEHKTKTRYSRCQLLIFFISIFILTNTAFSQEQSSAVRAQRYLDSLRLLDDTQMESYLYYYTGHTLLDNGFYITHAEYCFTDDCVDIRYGLVSPSYDTILPFFDVLLPVNEIEFILKNYEYDLVIRADTSWKVVDVYDHLGFFEYGYASVAQNNRFGIIDRKGRIVLPLKYDFVESFDYLGRAALKLGEKWKILEKDSLIAPLEKVGGWGELERMIELIKVYDNGKWSFLDEAANQVTPFKYDDALTFPGGYAAAKREGSWGIINYQGRELTPFKYHKIVRHYTWEYTLAQINRSYGFIDNNGVEITPFKYSQVSQDYHYDSKIGIYFFVREIGNKFGVMDRDGKELTEMKYDQIKGCLDCHGGLQGKVNGQWLPVELK